MAEIVLSSSKRELTGKKVKRIRKQGLLPIILYGHQIASKPLQAKKDDFLKVYKTAGTSSLVDLKVDSEKPIKVLIHSLQKDPVSDELLHADLYQVKMTEKIETEVPIKLEGESAAVKEQDGTLVSNRDHVKISCLPQDLISEIEVDISVLKTFEAKILVKNLNVPKGVEILDEPEEVVALVEPPRTEEELAKLEEAPVTEEKEAVEKIEAEAEVEKEKKEGEEVTEEGKTTKTEGKPSGKGESTQNK